MTESIEQIVDRIGREPPQRGCHKMDRLAIDIFGKPFNNLDRDERIAIEDLWSEML